MMKLAFMRTAPGKEDQKSAAEDKIITVTSLRNRQLTAPQFRAHINASQSSTSTVQRSLLESAPRGGIAAKKPLLRDNNKKKRSAWAKKHKQWTLDQWKSVLWCDESNFVIFGSNHCVFARCREGEQMVSACVVPTVKHGGGGVMVWGCFAGFTVGDLFKGTPNQHGYHNILQRHAIPSGSCLVGPSFFFQQGNDPKHTSRLCNQEGE